MCPLLMSRSEPEPSGAIFPAEPTLNRILEQQVEAGFPPELALDLVLQELVMRAVDATGANSAALALARGGDEMICRAATGLHAPDLGVPLNTHDGLSGACLRTRQPQFCVDTESDPRVDSAIARRLGIRSMLIVPVLDQDDSDRRLRSLFFRALSLFRTRKDSARSLGSRLCPRPARRSRPGAASARSVPARPIRSTAIAPRDAPAYVASLRRSPSIPAQDSTSVPEMELDSWNARHSGRCCPHLHGWLPPRMVGLIIAPGSSPGSPSIEIRCGKAPRNAGRAHRKSNLAQSGGTFHPLRTTGSHSQRG